MVYLRLKNGTGLFYFRLRRFRKKFYICTGILIKFHSGGICSTVFSHFINPNISSHLKNPVYWPLIFAVLGSKLVLMRKLR